jgi:hypothetical protein
MTELIAMQLEVVYQLAGRLGYVCEVSKRRGELRLAALGMSRLRPACSLDVSVTLEGKDQDSQVGELI